MVNFEAIHVLSQEVLSDDICDRVNSVWTFKLLIQN